MTRPQTNKQSNRDILYCYVTIASLIVLLEKSNLSHAVKNYCKTGFKVIEVLYTNRIYNTGIESLFSKEFDDFFRLFIPVCSKSRGKISTSKIIRSIELCIKHDMLLSDISTNGGVETD